jgi:sporulation protein YlmC with PRC-barrel domain
MPATFIREMLTLPVRDARGDLLGHVGDFSLDIVSGAVNFILVTPQPDIDSGRLPWPLDSGMLKIPVEEVATVGSDIRLNR